MAEETQSASQRPHANSASTLPSAAAFVALRSGLVIRHYVIEEVIGAGGFGITYRARHERLKSKMFALKEFFPREFAARTGTQVISTRDGEGVFRWGLDRFLKEAEALAKCEHPGIVDVIDYFEENGTAYAVLEYVEGRQFGQWLDGLGRLPTQAELDRILMPLLDALEVVHEAKLLHRDIAPDNILVRRDGSPCLIDFGACREDIRERSRKVSAIVKHGYSPPEQYHGIAELQGPWTDIYAVGATFYRAVAGAPPMDSSRRGALGDGLKPLSDIASTDYRPGFLAGIDRALCLKPDERPGSIREWRRQLVEEAITAPRPSKVEEEQQQVADVDRQSVKPDVERKALDDPKNPNDAGQGRKRAVLAIGFGIAALLSMGAVALWRAPSTPPRNDTTAKTKVLEKAETATEPKPEPISPIVPDAEQAAASAWAQLAGSSDLAAIERFLELHGTTSRASEARARLAALRDEARRAEAARADAERAREAAERAEAAASEEWSRIRQSTDPAAIERFLAAHGKSRLGDTARSRLREILAEAEARRLRDTAWAACRAAPDASKIAACSRVIDSDDVPERRATALHLRGVAERKAGKYDKAIADLTRSLELASGNAQVFSDRGIAHFLRNGAGDRQAALSDYDAAIKADPRHAEALNNRAWSIFQAGRASEALVDANRSIEAVATNGYAYDTRGQILEALGRREEAIRDYERAIQIDPSQEASRAGLQRLKGARPQR